MSTNSEDIELQDQSQNNSNTSRSSPPEEFQDDVEKDDNQTQQKQEYQQKESETETETNEQEQNQQQEPNENESKQTPKETPSVENNKTQPEDQTKTQKTDTTQGDAVIDMDIDTKDGGEAISDNPNPVLLEWRNLHYSVSQRKFQPRLTKNVKDWLYKDTTHILKGLSGYCAPGHTLAIMGPSGAGKSTLLNILSQRVTKYTGEIYTNNTKRTKSFRSLAAYVQQDDVLLGNLTVRETLQYSALMRLNPKDYTYKQKMERVEKVIRQLGLSKVAKTKVGIPGLVRGVSGGERKRVNIGVELITNPSVLFLDEPTSGLDAKTAFDVMKTITKLSKQGRTVICTIHQPRSNIFDLFDQLCVLANGRTAYFGDAHQAIDYFEKLGYECPAHFNPADFFIDMVTETASDESEEKAAQDENRIEYVLDSFEKIADTQTSVPDKVKETQPPQRGKVHRYNVNRMMQMLYVFLRATKNNARDKMVTQSRIIVTIVMSILVGLIYLQVDDGQASIQDRQGCLFFILLNNAFSSIQGVLSTFQTEKGVFLKERGSSVYSVSSYFIGRNLAELPQQLLFPMLFITISYWMIGLNPGADRFFIALMNIVVTAWAANSLGFLLSTAFPSVQIANILAPLIIVLFMLFGGFYLNSENIPDYFIWIEYTSFIKYGFEIFVVNEFDGLTFECPSSSNGEPVRCVETGDEVISNLGFENVNIWVNTGILIGMGFVFRLLSYLCLRFLRKPKGS
eukprot:gb/GECH01004440.1/.p1 GENE.gb/GECH01004440.1/~~gb/GECH01004440.1/.p1  ORF type:complete len:738 (+),score=196.21 gb/GECH01004440.1/:1-2214(+)